MILPHEVDRILRKRYSGQPLDSYDTNAIEMYRDGGFHTNVLDKDRKAFRALLDAEALPAIPAHPQSTERQLEIPL